MIIVFIGFLILCLLKSFWNCWKSEYNTLSWRIYVLSAINNSSFTFAAVGHVSNVRFGSIVASQISAVWPRYRWPASSWVASSRGTHTQKCMWACVPVHKACTCPCLCANIQSIQLTHTHTQRGINRSKRATLEPKHSWRASCGGCQGHRWRGERKTRERKDITGRGVREREDLMERKEEEGRGEVEKREGRREDKIMWDKRRTVQRGKRLFLVLSSHFLSCPLPFFICISSHNLPFPLFFSREVIPQRQVQAQVKHEEGPQGSSRFSRSQKLTSASPLTNQHCLLVCFVQWHFDWLVLE